MNYSTQPTQGQNSPGSAPSATGVSSLTDIWSERDILSEAEELGHVEAWAWHIASGQLHWTDETFRILGLRPQEFPASYNTFLDCVHPEDREQFEACVQAALEGTRNYDLEHRIVRPDGEVRTVHERGRVKRAESGEPIRMLGLVRDITEEKALQQERDLAQRALAQSEEQHRLLTHNAWDVIWTMGIDGSITYVSPSIERVRGSTPAEAMVQPLEEINTPASLVQVTEYFASVYQAIADGTTPPTFHGEPEYFRKDGSIMLGDLQVIPQLDADGSVVQLLGVTRDISERREFERILTRLAITDPLTDVWNRRQGAKLIDAGISETRRYGPSVALVLLMLDIDHFKSINDTYGHQTGDSVLIELTQVLLANMRSSDVLIRWGGEEFVILTRHRGLEPSSGLAMKLREIIENHPFETVGTVTVSIGVAELHPDDDLDSWLERADSEMYEAKAAGRNCVRVRDA